MMMMMAIYENDNDIKYENYEDFHTDCQMARMIISYKYLGLACKYSVHYFVNSALYILYTFHKNTHIFMHYI